MLRARCPTADKLVAFAKRPAKGRLSEHVENCPTCRRIVEDFRDEAALVKELRQAATAEPIPSVRRRLQGIAREAVRDPGNGHGPDAGQCL